MLSKQKLKLKERGQIKNHVFKGVDVNLKRLIHSFNNVIVYFDPDVDGGLAGLLVCRYLAKHNINFSWYINSNRSHDWTLPTEKVAGKDIIAVDFIITAEKIKELVDAGCNIVSMDHHVNRKEFIEYTTPIARGLVINNQYPFEEEDSRYLSGAGVVFETLIQLDPEFDIIEHRALVGISLLSDIRDIENELAERYLYYLYSHKFTGYIKYLIENTLGDKDYGFGLPKMDRNFVDFKFSPAINACFRFGQEDMVVNFLLGRGNLNLFYRDEQKKLTKDISSKLNIVELPKLKVAYFYDKEYPEYADVLSNFVGLVASKNLDGENSVICYMIGEKNNNLYIKRASFRGNINGLDYQKALSDYFLCLGHKSAFGIKGLVPSKKTFVYASRACRVLEANTEHETKVIEVVNLSFFVGNKAYEIAENNMYKLSQNQVYIKYTGNCIQRKRAGGNYIEYEVNGIPVLCFDLSKNFENGLIMPILDRGLLTFYLQ